MSRPNPQKDGLLRELARELARDDREPSELQAMTRLASRLIAPSERNRAELEQMVAEERLALSMREEFDGFEGVGDDDDD